MNELLLVNPVEDCPMDSHGGVAARFIALGRGETPDPT